ncbi:uncharacterized protein LOC110665282 isoform X2 [Hevea brasiliensis]|uniref:uncharacterized protein LOC110665282 isoform X2 n=1 Tax=Hevea brasiliensis TaxID=3981 RepID=UPI0025D52AB5|nr:uncharacterized protein LOC110665282 isoform X2 [Hevea brasiliensis]
MAAQSITKGNEKSKTMEVPLVEQDGAHLSKSIPRLETFLRFFGFCQYSVLTFVISWLSFLLLGIVLPVFMIKFSASAYVEKYQINSFEFQILVFQSLAAAISLVCISHNLRKYGVRNFLFVDRSHGYITEFRDEYIKKIHVVALFQTTGNKDIITLTNGGDFVISCIAELVGIIICLHAAAKATHRAQGVASIAAKWHSLVTCNSSDAAITSSSGNLEAPNIASLLRVDCSESDLESVDYMPMPTNTQLTSSYNKRQAFVTYLQSNPGGFSVFGWRIERTLINTIFFLEISLVLFVLGQTITFTSE